MHEQIHDEPVKTDGSGNPYKRLPGDMDAPKRKQTRAEAIIEISQPMREFALDNPCLTNDELNTAVASGMFSKFLRTQNTFGIYVLLTVSPSDDEKAETLFWHCSMSICSVANGRPKTVNLWTTRERRNITDLLKEFLGDCGVSGADVNMQTKTALHISRELNAEEFAQISTQLEGKTK